MDTDTGDAPIPISRMRNGWSPKLLNLLMAILHDLNNNRLKTAGLGWYGRRAVPPLLDTGVLLVSHNVDKGADRPQREIVAFTGSDEMSCPTSGGHLSAPEGFQTDVPGMN